MIKHIILIIMNYLSNMLKYFNLKINYYNILYTMEILYILNITNRYTKLTKNTCIIEAKNKLTELENLLKLKEAFRIQNLTDEEHNKRNKLFNDDNNDINYIIFLYIENYMHLSDDKYILRQIKEISLKLMKKFSLYFRRYHKNTTILR